MAFMIKRGDLRPNLPFQLLHSDGVTPLDLTSVISVSLVLASKPNQTSAPFAFKKACVIADAPNGNGYYEWASGDTNIEGAYQYEFEIIWADSDPQTVPVDSYFDLIIVDDLG
jgi:hypothetical protein